MKQSNWLKEKIIITLTRQEMFDLANVIAEGTNNDFYFTKSRDRKIRKMFRESIERRHRLWLKVTHTAQNYKPKINKMKEIQLVNSIPCDYFKCNRKAIYKVFWKNEYYCKQHMTNPTEGNKILYPINKLTIRN